MSKGRLIRLWVVIGVFCALAAYAVYSYAALFLAGPVQRSSSEAPVLVRGSLYDRAGRLLAVDTDLYDVSAWRPSINFSRIDEYATVLAAALGSEPADWLLAIPQEGPNFFFLGRRISGDAARTLESSLEKLRLSGIRLDRVAGRVYPERDLAAQLVGFVGSENRGLAGAESSFDAILAADPAQAHGGYAYGDSVYLTIDANLQYRLEELCGAAMKEHGAEAVVMVAMNAKTGEIAAYVSLPDFDPNTFLDADRSTWTDRVAIYAYEPGSVFKVFSMAGLMALGGIDDSSSFLCDGSYERVSTAGEEIRINCLGRHGWVDMVKILEYSCNAGAAYASDTVSGLDFYAKIREFGFGERTGADLSGESPGVLRLPADWSMRTKPTIAIGQEILVTAIQMATAATPLANGGMLIRPRTLSRVTDASGAVVDDPEPISVRRVMDERTAASVLSAMEAVVLDSGTGKRARISDLRMSVKTGTAQMIDPATRRYSDTDFIASTLAMFPSQAPEYIVYAAIIKPRGESFYGGRIAAPLVRDAANIVADLYGVAREGSTTITHPGSIQLKPSEAAVIGERMPDLTGYPKRLLTELLLRDDIRVEITGDGWVVRQDPQPGELVPPGSTVTLELE